MSVRLCSSCRNPRHCPGYDYFTPSEIKYCFSQILWLVSMLPHYEENFTWPPDPTPSGYVGIDKPQYKKEASFAVSVSIFGELKLRLELAGWKTKGKDGDTLMTELRHGLTVVELSWAARSALVYCAGNKRKRTKYGIWVSQRKYRPVLK